MSDRKLKRTMGIIDKGFVLLMAGIPVYVYMGWRKRKDAGAHAAEGGGSELEAELGDQPFEVRAPVTDVKFEVPA